jgi:hypothetical protein
MTWARPASPSVIEQNPSRRNASWQRGCCGAWSGSERCWARGSGGRLHGVGCREASARSFYAPAVIHLLQQSLSAGSHAGEVERGLINGLALADALAVHRQNRGAPRPVLHQPLRSGHALSHSGSCHHSPVCRPCRLRQAGLPSAAAAGPRRPLYPAERAAVGRWSLTGAW